jgi:uncharacterized protein (DUF3084 family)
MTAESLWQDATRSFAGCRSNEVRVRRAGEVRRVEQARTEAEAERDAAQRELAALEIERQRIESAHRQTGLSEHYLRDLEANQNATREQLRRIGNYADAFIGAATELRAISDSCSPEYSQLLKEKFVELISYLDPAIDPQSKS